MQSPLERGDLPAANFLVYLNCLMVILMREPTGFAVFTISCLNSLWKLPPMTKTIPFGVLTSFTICFSRSRSLKTLGSPGRARVIVIIGASGTSCFLYYTIFSLLFCMKDVTMTAENSTFSAFVCYIL